MRKWVRGCRGGYRLVRFLYDTRKEVNKINGYVNTPKYDEKAAVCMRRWGRKTLKTLKVEVDADYSEPGRPVIYVCNHKSYLDGAVIASFTGSFFVIKQEAFSWPFLGKYIRRTRNIPVKRDEMKSRMQSGLQIKQRILNGNSVVVFAEGTTRLESGFSNPHNGVFKLSAKTGIPIVPLVLEYENPNDAWVGNASFLPHFVRTQGKPHTRVSFKSGPLLASTEPEYLKHKTVQWIDFNAKQMRSRYDLQLVSPVTQNRSGWAAAM